MPEKSMKRIWYHLRSFTENARALGCLVLIALIVIFLIASVIMHFVDRPNVTPDTAYRVCTDTRLYLTNEITPLGEGDYSLHGYWDTQKGRWKYHKETFILTQEVFGDIKIEPELE